MTTTHLVILAGGSGSRAVRLGDETPKQFQMVAGRPLLAWSVVRLMAHPDVATLTMTCPDDDHKTLESILEQLDLKQPWFIAPAGPTRTASTWLTLEALTSRHQPSPGDLVAVHDAARPLADRDLLSRLIAAATQHGGAVPCVPVTDTTVSMDQDGRLDYLNREQLRAVQTPQVFTWEPFYQAHRTAAAANSSFTDDGGLMADAGHRPCLVDGDLANSKVTTADDLDALRSHLEASR